MTDKEKREVKIYIRLLLYYMRHRPKGNDIREFERSIIYSFKQYVPYVSTERRAEILQYIYSFMNHDMTDQEKIDLLQAELSE